MIKAVLFDMDGLLVNTERVYMQLNFEASAAFGYPMSEALYFQMLGVVKEIAEKVYVDHIPGFESEAFHAFIERAFRDKLENGEVQVKKGARQLLHYLRNRQIPRAVVTSSSLAWAGMILKAVKLASAFDDIIGGDAVNRSKPHPDIYLHAADRLHARPGACLVLEDSENGIKAGRAAGMKVCMVPDLLPYTKDYAPYCDCVCEDLAEVIAYIEKTNSERPGPGEDGVRHG